MKNSKRLTFSILVVILILMSLSAAVTEAQTAEKPIIVCTTNAVGSVVEEFVGDTAAVLVLVQPGLCPADFDMKPGYVDAVSKAQILFEQDIPGEFWLDALLVASGNEDLAVIAIPGVYNTPVGTKNYIRGVGGNLSKILGLDLNAKISQMLSDVDSVSSLMANQASTLEATNIKVICMGWLKTFIESAGFTVVATFNLQIDTEFGAGIASQVGAEHVILTNFPGAVPNTQTLPEMLKYNAEQLFNGIVTWKSTSELKTEKVGLQNQVAIFQIAAALASIVAISEAVLLYAKRRSK
jgi:hypothetical protein